MISSNVMSFMKKIVKASEDENSAASATGPTAGSHNAEGPIGKLRQTVASGMKEIRDKAVASSSGGPSVASYSPSVASNSPAQRGEMCQLTNEEKSILQQVWQKEAEFEKESLRQHNLQPPLAVASPKLVKKESLAVACRICLKSIATDEKYYICCECGQGVCDDCASYRKDTDIENKWKCSFCRRRQDRLGIDSENAMRRISSSHKVDSLKQSFSDEGRTDSTDSLSGVQRSPPAECIRRMSSAKTSSPETTSSSFFPLSLDRLSDTSKSSESFQSDQKHSSSLDQTHKLDLSKQTSVSLPTDGSSKSQPSPKHSLTETSMRSVKPASLQERRESKQLVVPPISHPTFTLAIEKMQIRNKSPEHTGKVCESAHLSSGQASMSAKKSIRPQHALGQPHELKRSPVTMSLMDKSGRSNEPIIQERTGINPHFGHANIKERSASADSQRNIRILPSTQPPPSTSSSPYRMRISSASESSIEEKSPDDDAESHRQNRLQRRTRFQRQKTFIDEHDSEDWMGATYPSNEDDFNSSFDSSSAFESFDNDGDPSAFGRHPHGYVQSSARPIRHIASDVTLYQRRRSSDSSDFSEGTDMSRYRMKGSSSRRPFVPSGAASEYEGDVRYFRSTTQSEATASSNDPIAARNRIEKSMSVDDPRKMGLRGIPKKQISEPIDDRRRFATHDYFLDAPRDGNPTTCPYAHVDSRAYHGHQQWARSARSLELSVDSPTFRRASLNEKENVKIVVDDVDGARKGGKHWTESSEWAYEKAHGNNGRNLNVSSRPKASSSSDVSRETEHHQVVGGRRRLPMTPDQMYHGEVGVRIWYDGSRADLVVTVSGAKGLRRYKRSVISLPRAYAKLRLLPYSDFGSYETPVAEATTNPEWNKTCAFPGIVLEEVLEKALEISVWNVEQGDDAKMLMGLVTISLRKADLKDNLFWYQLSLNQPSLSHPKASSTGMLVSTPAHDIARRLLIRGAQREMLQSQSLTDEGPVECYVSEDEQCLVKSTSMDSTLLQPEEVWPEGKPNVDAESSRYVAVRKDERKRLSFQTSTTDTRGSLPDAYLSDARREDRQRNPSDKRYSSSDTDAGQDVFNRQGQRIAKASRQENRKLDHAARSVFIGSSTDTDQSVPLDKASTTNRPIQRPSILKKSTSGASASSQTSSTAGKSKFGELKLGFSLQKGQLHLEVIKARGIRLAANGHPPDTYVKTYLKNIDCKGLKRKTSVVRQSTEPKFHQTLKYSVSEINHKTLMAMVWERHKRFEHNQAIGIVELDLSKLKLTIPFCSWYNLKPLSGADSESIASS